MTRIFASPHISSYFWRISTVQILTHIFVSVLLFAPQVLALSCSIHLGTASSKGHGPSHIRIQNTVGKPALASLGR